MRPTEYSGTRQKYYTKKNTGPSGNAKKWSSSKLENE
jgi:hypothetical protein